MAQTPKKPDRLGRAFLGGAPGRVHARQRSANIGFLGFRLGFPGWTLRYLWKLYLPSFLWA